MAERDTRNQQLAADYIRGPKAGIDANKPWSAKELQAYLNQSGLLEQDRDATQEDKQTTKRLNELYQKALDASKADTPEGRSSRVRQTGIKSNVDFLTFINSPAGKGAKTAIALQIKKRVEIRNQVQFEQRQQARKHALIRKFLLSLILLEYLEGKAHAAEVNEKVNEENAKRDEEYYDEKQQQQAGISNAEEEAHNLLDHHNALEQESDELQDKLKQTDHAIKQIDDKLSALETLSDHIDKALEKNKALHTETDSLLKQPSPKSPEERDSTLAALKAHTEHLQTKMDDLRDKLAKYTPTPDGVQADDLLDSSRAALDDRQRDQLKLSSQLQDLKEDHALLTHKTHLHTHAKRLDELKQLFVLEDEAGNQIPVYPELPPERRAQHTKELCELGDGALFDQEEKSHIEDHDIEALELFQDWMDSPYRFYDKDGHRISVHDKHDKAAYMLPRQKNLIVHNGVKYIVPSRIKTPEDLKKLSGSELLSARHEARENPYRPANRYCQNCIERASQEKDELLMTQKGYKETYVMIQAEIKECGNEARRLTSEIAVMHQRQDEVVEGKSPILNLSPSRGSSRVAANFSSRSEHAQAAYLAMTVMQTEQIVEEYIAAVGEDKLVKTGEYDVLQRIMASGSPDEKRNLLLRLETQNGSITASYKESMSSPYSDKHPTGSPDRRNAADLRLEGTAKPQPQHSPMHSPWRIPTPKPK